MNADYLDPGGGAARGILQPIGRGRTRRRLQLDEGDGGADKGQEQGKEAIAEVVRSSSAHWCSHI